MDIGDQKIGSEITDQTNTNHTGNNDTKRVCHFCHKEFGSGKALGGHMRIHVQRDDDKKKLKMHHTIKFKKQNASSSIANYYGGGVSSSDNNNNNNETVIKTPNCVICHKDFPTWKSLYGHMRCHPDRGWKGINPPPTSSSMAKNSSSPSSSLSDDDQNMMVLAFGEVEDRATAVSLEGLLNAWPVKAERGRKAIVGTGTAASSSEVSSSVDVELLNAANCILMLSREPNSFESQSPNVGTNEISKKIETHNSLVNEDKGCNEVVGNKNETQERVRQEHHDVMIDREFEGTTNSKVQQLKKSPKKRKKVKLSDLELAKNVTTPSTPVDKYKCDICDKTFSTHQAFGGHRSSHNKQKIVIINSNDKAQPSQVGQQPSEASPPVCRRGLEFDLNEVPPSGSDHQFDSSLI